MTLTPEQQAQWDAVREKIANWLEAHSRSPMFLDPGVFLEDADKLLKSVPKLAVLDSDQTPPKYGCSNYMLLGDDGRASWDRKVKEIEEIQQELIDAGFRRVLPRPEEVRR